jgi:lysophospholipase
LQQFVGQPMTDPAPCFRGETPQAPHTRNAGSQPSAEPLRRVERIACSDGVSLLVRHYEPVPDPPGRTLLVVHGLSEHGDRYDHVARYFARRGWRVVVPDARGHGQSGGTATHVRRFRWYCEDLNAVLDAAGAEPERTAVIAHSMGGLIAVRHTQRFPGRTAALVLMSPLLRVRVRVPAGLFVLGRVLSFVAPRARFRSRIDPSLTTRNSEALARRLTDPLIHRSVTAGWFFAMRRALRNAWREAPQMRVPLLLVQAGHDRIVDPDASREWLETAGSPDRTFECLPEHYHELLNEPDWSSTADFVARWLDARVPVAQRIAR